VLLVVGLTRPSGDDEPISIPVERAALGTLVIQPDPANARVLIDGVDRGSGAIRIVELPLSREIRVRVEAEGYRPIDQVVTLTADRRELTMPIRLAKQP
jgi:hypothetical protein